MKAKILITADDFGLSEALNLGIIRSHTQGAVRSAALLVAGPARDHAVQLARAHPSLEVGLHLAFVESRAVTGKTSSLTDVSSYFGDGSPCLHRNWKSFAARWARGAIRRSELLEELSAQFESFLRDFPSIPFVNSTQHLHLLPGISDMVLDLCVRYGVKAARTLGPYEPGQKRAVSAFALSWLGNRFRAKAVSKGLALTDASRGFEAAGQIGDNELARYLNTLRADSLEICTHPGMHDPALFQLYPGAFAGFDWEKEMRALCSRDLLQRLATGFELTRFGELARR